jgi:signal transduction histidine kinase
MRVVESEWEGRAACIASLRDVTERKRAEHDARELIREHAARAAAEEAARRLRALAEANAQLYEEARRANKTKSDFLAVVSHDLRTPLTAIIGYVDLMEMGVPDPLPEATLERLQRIRTSATHLKYLLNELLVFARLDGGREEVRLSDVDLRDIGREAAAVAEPLANERDLRFHLDLPEDPVILRTDADKVRQVLLNLVGNAVKYTREGEIRVELRKPAERLATLCVRDTGVGIAEEHVQQIFEPFWQVDPDQRARDGGTGLGLSVVRRLVQLLGGEVSVESKLGNGSTFTVTLPSR